jgi:hypothetical protein
MNAALGRKSMSQHTLNMAMTVVLAGSGNRAAGGQTRAFEQLLGNAEWLPLHSFAAPFQTNSDIYGC